MLLQLTNGGKTEVDEEDYIYFSKWKWQQLPKGHVYRCDRTNRVYYLHKEIVKRLYGYYGDVDHKDRNALNNRRQNLRPSTRSQNKMNQGLTRANTSGYKGVIYDAARSKYKVEIQYRGNKVHIGRFNNLVEAARAYDKAAKQYHGEFAVLNFPESS